MQLRIFLLSIGINLLLFTVFLLFTESIYATGEDVFVLYSLSGGFGNEPTELLHYNHLMHPYLSYMLKELFRINNAINWYTLALLAGHFTAFCILLYLLFRRKFSLVYIPAMLTTGLVMLTISTVDLC